MDLIYQSVEGSIIDFEETQYLECLENQLEEKDIYVQSHKAFKKLRYLLNQNH